MTDERAKMTRDVPAEALADAVAAYIDAWNARAGEFHGDCPCVGMALHLRRLDMRIALVAERDAARCEAVGRGGA